uniref:Meiosis specific with coiled-coil domain n=1 Tax=Monopterus albus TaxID=43700 RepID=A0A3Q3IPC6_MONAL|nr:meiosis-specific coiled-coil domain-containing protein MEIOC isoform X2 [Monopterus albus]
MAFNGHQGSFVNHLFLTNHRQDSVNIGGGNNESMALPFVSIPSGSLQEQDTTSYVPWSHNAHDDPCELVKYAQSSIKSRKPTDNTDCDGETDLQGLVSNILDEADSQDNYYSEGSLPTCNPVWSPKTLREDLLQYFQSEAKMQQNPTFPPNYMSCEAFGKAQRKSVFKDVEEFCQQSNGLSSNQHWLFNLPKGDRDNYTLHPQKLPPGLPVPNKGNAYLSQIQQSKYDTMSADRDRGNSPPMINFPDLNNAFRQKSEMNSPCFDPYYEDHYIQNSTKPSSPEQYVQQDNNQLVSSFQLFMAGEQDSFSRGDFPNMHKQGLAMHHEDNMVEQWKVTSPVMSAQSTPAIQTQKQLVEEFGIVQRNGGLRKQAFKSDTYQDLPSFSPQNREHFQQPKPFSTSLNFPNQHQNSVTIHRGNINVSMNHYSKHHNRQGQILNKIRSQTQKEKMMYVPGVLGESFSPRPLTNTYMRERDKKQALSQNPYFDLQGSMESQRFDGENSMQRAGNTQQFMPLISPVNDPRRQSSIPINCNFNSRATLPYGGSAPAIDVGDMMFASESAAFGSCVSNMMTHRGKNTYHGMAPVISSVLMKQGGPVIQLYLFLDECYEQWRCLEKERKRTEVILTKTFVGKRTASVTSTNLPKALPNPTRVDHLIVKQIREQAKVASLLDRMECLHNVPLPMNIHTALNTHQMAICITQARRKEEIANMPKLQEQRAHFTEDRDTLLLVALKDLAATTRKLRTALWCALQMTLPKPVRRQCHHVEAPHRERCFSPFEGYSFKL